MGTTPFMDVYDYAFTEIDDVRMSDLMDENPALFLRRCWDYLRNAIPLFTDPKGIQNKMQDYVAPILTDVGYTGDGTTTVFSGTANAEDIVVMVGAEVVAILEADLESGDPVTDNGVTYDPATGDITFAEAPAVNDIISIDFSAGGYFNQELTKDEIAILGKCFSIVWFNKIANTFLRTTPKIKDKNFNTDSSFGVEQADTAKLRAMRIELQDMMAAYENTLAYKAVVPSARQLLNR